jgi:Domain of unknown function (DUF4398)
MRALGILVAVLAAALAGCAFVPTPNHRLDEAQTAHHLALADPGIVHAASAELARAGELLELASAARNTLDDVAVVDHLAYMAKQRVAIAREAAILEAATPR